MRASGAGDGFGWRRRLRGRRARGGPASPAALPYRGERRHGERQGKGLGGPSGPAVSLLPPAPRDSGRPDPASGQSAEAPPPGRGRGLGGGAAALVGQAWAGSQAGSGALASGFSKASPPACPPRPQVHATPANAPRPSCQVQSCCRPPSGQPRAGLLHTQDRPRPHGGMSGFRGYCFCVPSQLCVRRSWSCWDRTR